MLHQAPSIYQSPKCFVTYGTMGHVDPKQIPSKGKPWTAISDLDFIHKVSQSFDVETKVSYRMKYCY